MNVYVEIEATFLNVTVVYDGTWLDKTFVERLFSRTSDLGAADNAVAQLTQYGSRNTSSRTQT